MKRLRNLLVMVLGLIVSSSAFAQSSLDYDLDEIRPLVTDVSQLSSPWSEPELDEGYLSYLLDDDPETYWHTNWHSSVEPHLHYLQVALIEPIDELISMKFSRRWHNYRRTALCTDDHVTKWSVYGSDDPEASENNWIELAVMETPYKEPGETLNTIGFDTKGKQYLRFYADATNTGRGYWHMAEFQLYPCTLVDELTSAMRELIDVYFQYESYAGPFQENAGYGPGQYLPEAVAAFTAALDQANEMDSGQGTYTAEDVRALIETIKTTYQAVLDSKVPLTLADGYYRLRHAVIFLNSLPTGEVDEEGNPLYESREVNKYMYSTQRDGKIVARWNTPANLDTDCPSLWKVTNKDGLYDIVNCATDARFDNWVSSVLTMSKESQNLIAVDLIENLNGDPCVALRVSTQGTNCYFHPLGHGIARDADFGTGVENDIIGWSNDASKVSEWVFVPVDEATAAACIEAYEPYKNHSVLVENFEKMREDAEKKLEIAKDLSYSDPYIKDVSQLSSPWNAPHDFEGNLAHNIDGDPLTYWHTTWNDNSNRHYLQVALNEPVNNLICMKFTRRLYKYNSTDLCTADHATEWGFYGSDDPNAPEEDWVQLAMMETPYNAPGETIVTDGFDPQGKQYLRIYGEATNSGNRWWHVAELQLYPSPIETIDSPTSQYHIMGNVATTLEDVLTRFADLKADDATVEQYNELKAAYDAFIAKFVDPAPLRNKIEEVMDAGEIVEIGTDPGFWQDKSASDNLAVTITSAQAYDTAGAYTAEQSQTFIDNLDAAVANIKASANPVQTGKWYRFRFGTEQEYADHNWDVAGNQTDYRVVNGEATDIILNEESFGKYMTVARLERIREEDEYGAYTQNFIVPVEKEDVHIDDQLYFDALEDIENPDMALFRFVSVGDSAYIIQNKATGLYLQKKTDNNDGIFLSVHPSFFAQEIVGYGQNALFIRTLNNEPQNPLHFARNTNVVITYGRYGDTDGRRGCLFIEDAGEVASDYAENTARICMWEGEMAARCFPVAMKATDEEQGTMWTVASIEQVEASGDEEAQIKVTLAMMADNEVAAGRPFIYVMNGEYYPAEERGEGEEPELVTFTFGSDFVTEPMNNGALKGAFTRTTIGAGVLTVGPIQFERTTATNTAVNTDYAYIAAEEAFPRNYKIEIVFDEEAEDGITSVLQKVATRGGIYTLDGRLVSKQGNLNSLRGIQPGIYVVNGIKVIVK